MKYYIENITNHKGVTRTDDRYPNRIGSTVRFLHPIEKGSPMLFQYIKYKHGVAIADHITLTSRVNSFEWKNNKFYVTTNESIYIFKRLNNKEGEE